MVPANIPSCSHGNGGGPRPLRHRSHHHHGPAAADPSVYPVVGGESGVIASYTSRALGVGTTVACPWVIVAQPGQRINLTLMSFAAAAVDGRRRSGADDEAAAAASCGEYAVVAERSKYRDIVVCNQRTPPASVSALFVVTPANGGRRCVDTVISGVRDFVWS